VARMSDVYAFFSILLAPAGAFAAGWREKPP